MTLIEVVVAISIFAVVLVALGGLMFQVARHTRHSIARVYRSAAQQNTSTWVRGMPWDSLPEVLPGGPIGCSTDTTGQLVYTRCSTVQSLSSSMRRVTVVIAPTGGLVAPPDTVVIDRNRPLPSSPLN